MADGSSFSITCCHSTPCEVAAGAMQSKASSRAAAGGQAADQRPTSRSGKGGAAAPATDSGQAHTVCHT
jgi:hypothetical protein